MYYRKIVSLMLLSITVWSQAALAAPSEIEERDLAKRTTPPAATDATFIKTIMTRANGYRPLHAASALTWNATLATAARTAASKCNGQHTTNNPYGENIFEFALSPSTTVPNFTLWAMRGTADWYSEVPSYNVNDPDSSLHFTQLVWKASKQIGCSWSSKQCSDNGEYYLYCEFYPRGNVIGSFPANVANA